MLNGDELSKAEPTQPDLCDLCTLNHGTTQILVSVPSPTGTLPLRRGDIQRQQLSLQCFPGKGLSGTGTASEPGEQIGVTMMEKPEQERGDVLEGAGWSGGSSW